MTKVSIVPIFIDSLLHLSCHMSPLLNAVLFQISQKQEDAACSERKVIYMLKFILSIYIKQECSQNDVNIQVNKISFRYS